MGVVPVLTAALALHVEQEAVVMVIAVAIAIAVLVPCSSSRIVKMRLMARHLSCFPIDSDRFLTQNCTGRWVALLLKGDLQHLQYLLQWTWGG